jgi:hypothetical protein
LLAATCAAQETRGTIAGMVTDAQASGVPGARVTITNVDTGVDVALVTNDRGAYSAPLLLPGSYRIAAEHEGFKKFTRGGVTLSINENLRIDILLELGAVTETVNVTDSAPLIEASSGNMGVVVAGKEVTELPLAHGNPYVLIGLAPGATFEGDPTLNRPYEPGHIAAYTMGGSAAGTTDITMDGVVNTYKGSAVPVGVAYSPPADSIGEMRIETSSFDARAGQTSGGVINISLRSGTNKVKGSFTFTKMRPEWMANTWFGNASGTPRGDFDYNRWAASLSGPIYVPKVYNGRNKTFFMWSYEALSDQRPRGGTTLTVPTASQRKGDFSDLPGAAYQIYNPFTRRRETGSTTRYRIDPFPGNIVPASLFNPVALKVMEYFPAPLNDGTTADHRYNFPKPNSPEVADYYTHVVRVDHNFSSANRMFVRGNGYVRDTHRNDYFETRASGIRENYKPIGFAADDVHTLSPTVVLNIRYGYTRVDFETTPLYGRNFDLSSLGFPKSFSGAISPDKSEFPAFEISNYFSSLRTGSARYMDTHSLVVAVTKLRGSHTFDFGFEARSYRQNQYTGDTARSGRFIFDQTWTRGPLDNSNSSAIGQGWASFLMGLLSSSANGYVSRPADYAEASTVWCGYAQDNWRVKRNLTINLGVRYELEGPLTERYNRSIRDFNGAASLPIEAAARAAYASSYSANPTAELTPDQFRVGGGLVFAGRDGEPSELWSRDINNIAPRVSLAYSVGKGTVIRAGYGIFFGGLGLRRADVLQNGFARNTQIVPTKDSGLTFYSTLSNPFPDGILEPVGADLGLMTDVGNSISFFNPAPKASYNQRWQVSLQRQIGGANMVEVAYVGNRSTKLEISRDLNIVGNQLLSRSPVYDQQKVNYLTASIANPFRGLSGVNGTMGANNTISRETLLKPYPQFTAVNTTTYQGYSWYHSLQVRGARRLSRGLNLNASFTWARTMNATSFQNPADSTPYESLSSADRPYRVSASILYQLPFGRRGSLLRTAPRWVDEIIGGWQLSTIIMYQSGAPLAWGDVIFLGDPADIAKGDKTVQRWFNTDAGFTKNSSTRPSYHYRTWPFYFSNLRRDAMENIDLSINKRWRLNERGTEVQVRGEAINAFNHPMFGAPQMDQFNSAFGQITATANYPRQIQAVFRITF